MGTLPPVQVTFWTTASSPGAGLLHLRFQPGDGTKESIAKPGGSVSSIFVVVASSFSVGTASVKTCPCLRLDTGGLTRACAEAPAPTGASAARPSNDGRGTCGLR